ncbi:unnamed protein product [Cylindrotheca closterium]|uniref:SHSP domain-containing protein n=1 Tax=Cylindrotheca closterium TaxID=2856 RepID=A0AAD2FFZ7_9STRA|nr:unnamed protein product [Cylindrotheca closterium]
MSLLLYDPFTSVFDDAFDRTPFFRNEQLMPRAAGWKPSGMRSHEDDKNYVFQVDLPGVKADDLKMKLDDTHRGHTVIHLSGGRQFQSKDGTSFETSSFERQFSIGSNVDKEKIGADLKDGVLTITVPKKEPEKTLPKYIPITSGAAKAAE